MSMRKIVFVALAAAILCGVVGVLVLKRETSSPTVPELTKADKEVESARPDDAARPVEPPATPPQQRLSQENLTPSINESQTPAQANRSMQRPAQAPQGTIPVQPATEEAIARMALSYVGADADAETYWYGAINNPNLSAQARQNLIGDLNEDGLSDPQNPTADDLPLILNRIQLIESVAWDAMDEVNAAAFQEAYKDLVNLAIQIMARNSAG